MNVLLVAMLVGLWIWLLSPGVLRDRRPRSPIASIDSFERYMDILAPLSSLPTSGADGTVQPPPSRGLPAQRRRFFVTWLTVILTVTLAVSLTVGGWTRWLPLVPAVLLGAYLAALAEFHRRAELRARVSRLPGPELAAADRDETERQAREA
jgi:uncharacterized membrane protein YphA (DoxX/SURF4 family)